MSGEGGERLVKRLNEYLPTLAGPLLSAPCVLCGYSGAGYYQTETHGERCPWRSVGGWNERYAALPTVLAAAFALPQGEPQETLEQLIEERDEYKFRWETAERVISNLQAPAPQGEERLRKALEPFAEKGTDLTDLMCHRGLCSAEECCRCSKVLAARAALAPEPRAEGEGQE